MKIYFCLDTCTWIYLANGTEPVKFLQDIQDLLNQGRLCIILPQIVEEEWNRNKDKGTIQKPILSSFTELNKQIKQVSAILDKVETHSPFQFLFEEEDKDTKKELVDIKSKIESNKNALLNKVNNNIITIESIFNHESTIKISPSANVLLRAGEIALGQKAPIHKKNGFADAVILLTFIDYVKSNSIENSYFISYNTDDFCQTENKVHSLHTDLKPLFDDAKSKFFNILGGALKDVDGNLVDNETLELIERSREDYAEYFCTECDGYEGFGNEIHFYPPEEIFNENTLRYAQQETTLFGEDEIGTVVVPRLVGAIQLGYCNHCSTQYIKCQNCEDIIQIEEYTDEDIFACSCGIRYKRESEWDRKGQESVNWSIIDDRTKVCEGCGEEFIDNIGTGICKKCEDIINDK